MMNASEFDTQFRERLNALATSNLSDALDSLGITRCAVAGITPRWGRTKVVGRAVTIKMTAAGAVPARAHLGIDAIAHSQPGDVIVGDSDGILVIPPFLVEEVVNEAIAQEEQEEFIAEVVAGGEPVKDVFPLNPAWKAKFEAWKAARS